MIKAVAQFLARSKWVPILVRIEIASVLVSCDHRAKVVSDAGVVLANGAPPHAVPTRDASRD